MSHSKLDQAFRQGRAMARGLRMDLLFGVLHGSAGPAIRSTGGLEVDTRVRLGVATEVLQRPALERFVDELRSTLVLVLYPRAGEADGDVMVLEGPSVGRKVPVDRSTFASARRLWEPTLGGEDVRVFVDAGKVIEIASPRAVEEHLKELLALPVHH